MGKVHINASAFSFQQDEAHFSEEVYFDELAENGEVIQLDLEVYFCQHGRTSRNTSLALTLLFPLGLVIHDVQNIRNQIARRDFA